MRKVADTDISLDGTAEKGENATGRGPRVPLSLALSSSASLHCQHQSLYILVQSEYCRLGLDPSRPRNMNDGIIFQLRQHALERAVAFPPLPP